MATQRILQNKRLLWVDTNISETEDDTQQTLEQLRTIVPHIDQCLQLLHKVNHEQVLIITSGYLGPQLLEQIRPLRQVDAIYIFCDSPDRH